MKLEAIEKLYFLLLLNSFLCTLLEIENFGLSREILIQLLFRKVTKEQSVAVLQEKT
jgi:hypothetical protein